MKMTGVILKKAAFILLIAMLAISFGVGASSAFTSVDVNKVQKTKSCPGCNLRHANLSGVDLSNGNLGNADLGGANLKGAKLSGAKLSGAKLGDAVLTNANLTGADLSGATLAGAYMMGADFSQAIWVDGKVCGPKSVGKCKK